MPESDAVRALLTAAYQAPISVGRLGLALWLYVWLVLRANRTGRVCRAQASLALDLQVSDEVIGSWLTLLVEAKLVAVSAPAPYLVLKLRFWPDSSAERNDSGSLLPRAHAPGSLQQNSKEQAGSREDGGQGEGEAVVAEALRILGSANEIEIRDLVQRHPASLVWTALHRVGRTPRQQIRKSRLALFRYLLVTLTQRSYDRHPSYSA